MPKETFPTDNDIKRLLQLKRYENLYEGDHFKEFGIKEYFKNVGGKGKYIYIAINLAASISEYFADMVVGDDIQFKVKEKEVQKKIDAISKHNNLAITLYESAMSQSEFGFVPIRVRKDEETNKSIIEEIPVDQYFPEETKIINGKAKRVVLGSYLTILDEMDREKEYLYKQIYTHEGKKVFLQHELWTINFDKTQDKKTDLSIYDNTLSEDKIELKEMERIPIWQINNIKNARKSFGKSDYKDVEPLFEELNERVTQIALQLIKHLTSKMAVPSGTLDEKGEVKAAEADMIEIDENGFVPQYIANQNAQLDTAIEHIKNVIRQISGIVKIPAESLGLEGKGGAEKVETLKIRLFDTIRKIQRKRRYMKSALQEIMEVALKIEGGSLKEDQEITIEWGNILPTDELSLTQILGEQVTVGLKSRRRAVKELQKLDEEALDEELKRIETENQAQVPSISSPPQIKSTEELINA